MFRSLIALSLIFSSVPAYSAISEARSMTLVKEATYMCPKVFAQALKTGDVKGTIQAFEVAALKTHHTVEETAELLRLCTLYQDGFNDGMNISVSKD